MENLMTSQRLTKGLNELANTFITFMVSIGKVIGLSLCFLGVRKTFPSDYYGSTFKKLDFINKLKHFFLSGLSRDCKPRVSNNFIRSVRKVISQTGTEISKNFGEVENGRTSLLGKICDKPSV